MDKIFTSYLTYEDISVEMIDLLEDAFLSDLEYSTLLDRMSQVVYEPSPHVLVNLLKLI